MKDWHHGRLRRVFLDMHMPDWTRPGQSGNLIHELRGVATRFNPAVVAQTLAAAHVNAAVFFAKDQYGNFYYNTSYGHKHTGLGEMDLLGRLVEESHRLDIKVSAYYSVFWDVEAARGHPEWMMRDVNGTTSYARWPRACINSPYGKEALRHIDEVAHLYSIDGLWLDMLFVLPCYCGHCERRFQELTGERIPRRKHGSVWQAFLKFQYDYVRQFIADARKCLALWRPEAALAINLVNFPHKPPSSGMDATGQVRECDYAACDGYTDWHGMYFPVYAAKHTRAAVATQSFEVLTSRFNHTWDFSMRPVAQMAYEAYTAVANGAAVILDDEPYHDGRLEGEVYGILAPIYDEIARREPYLLDVTPMAYAAVYHSLKVRELDEMFSDSESRRMGGSASSEGDLPPFPESIGRDISSEVALQGAVKLLVDAHLPVEIVHDQNVTLEVLKKFRVVYLPNIVTFSDEEVEVLRRYVFGGGGLVATFQTGLFTRLGARNIDFLLADLFGVSAIEKAPYSFPYVRIGDHSRPLPHYGSVMHVRSHPKSDEKGALVRPIIDWPTAEAYYANNKPAPYVDTSYPFSTWSTHGAGRVVYCAGQPEINYGLLGMPEYRDWVKEALVWAAGEMPDYAIDALPNVEFTVMCQNDRDIVHLILCQPSKQLILREQWGNMHTTSQTVEAVCPLYNVMLTIPNDSRAVTLAPSGEALMVVRKGDRTLVTIPRVDLWSTIVVERSKRG